jgi:hypothetical protein
LQTARGVYPPLLQFLFSLFHFPAAPPVVPYCVRKRSPSE